MTLKQSPHPDYPPEEGRKAEGSRSDGPDNESARKKREQEGKKD